MGGQLPPDKPTAIVRLALAALVGVDPLGGDHLGSEMPGLRPRNLRVNTHVLELLHFEARRFDHFVSVQTSTLHIVKEFKVGI